MRNQAFGRIVVDWYRRHKRDLPWRNTRDPYHIWLSEVLLQQTRVVQGLPYYEKFLERFPTLRALAEADEKDVLKLWQGLGYYSRARNLHFTARWLTENREGRFPASYAELLQLKGVGPYTAAAIASFCFQEAVPVFDGNVYRVLSRYFGVREPVNGKEGKKRVEELGHRYMLVDEIADYNQGIMEFGALQCTPQSPDCSNCPLQLGCHSYREGMVAEIPVKLKRSPIKKLYFNYLVFQDPKGYTLLERRPSEGIWPGLYQFPLWETRSEVKTAEIEVHLNATDRSRYGPFRIEQAGSFTHKLSHREIRAFFWRVRVKDRLEENTAVSWRQLDDFPVPVLISRFMETVDFH